MSFSFRVRGEAGPKKEQEGRRVRDFEERPVAPHLSESGDLGLECGKCAEHLLWLELSSELILSPKDDEMSFSLLAQKVKACQFLNKCGALAHYIHLGGVEPSRNN